MRWHPPAVFVNWSTETDPYTDQFEWCHTGFVPPNTRPSHALPFTMVQYCELCGCNLSSNLPSSLALAQHNQGRRHLRNVATIGIRNPATPGLPPPPPVAPDARVAVSHEDGLDFVVEGREVAGQPSFFPVEQTILIEKTQVASSLSVPSLRLIHPTSTPASWCGLFDESI